MYELGGGICLGKPFERVGILGWEAHIQTCKRDEFLFNLKPNQASVVDKSSWRLIDNWYTKYTSFVFLE